MGYRKNQVSNYEFEISMWRPKYTMVCVGACTLPCVYYALLDLTMLLPHRYLKDLIKIISHLIYTMKAC